MPTSFGERLAEQRATLGFSQLEICDFTAVNRRTQSKYETGKSFPDARYLTTLISHGFDIVYLLTGEEAPTREIIDETFLRDVLAAVDKSVAEQPPPLDLDKKAAVASLLFQISFHSKTIDATILERLIKLARQPNT